MNPSDLSPMPLIFVLVLSIATLSFPDGIEPHEASPPRMYLPHIPTSLPNHTIAVSSISVSIRSEDGARVEGMMGRSNNGLELRRGIHVQKTDDPVWPSEDKENLPANNA
jgi:hypothetical protein